MVEMMEQDPTITDIRWMAYMLTTTFIESSSDSKGETEDEEQEGQLGRPYGQGVAKRRACGREGPGPDTPIRAPCEGEGTGRWVSPRD